MKISFAIPLGAVLWLAGSWTQVAAQEPGACPRDASPDVVTLVGRVVDEATEVPLPSAVVTAEWTTAEAGALGAEVRTDSYGFYRLCRLPTGPPLTLQASFGSRATDPVTARLESPPVAYDFRLPPEEGAGVTVEARPRAGPGRILGRARDAESLKPIESAVITLRRAGGPEADVGEEAGVGEKAGVGEEAGVSEKAAPEPQSPPFQALTNSQGRFLIRDVPGGTYGLELRHVAYGSVHEPIQVPAHRTLEVDLRVPPAALEMEPIVVKAVRDRRLEIKGFYERREWGEKLGLGHFITREDIERRQPLEISHMIAEFLRRPRGPFCGGPKVLVDRIEWGFIPHPADVAGVEIYKGPASLPAEFGGSDARCGVVVIWTRSH